MNTHDKPVITVEATVGAPAEKIWRFWTEPGHIMKWNNASEDWHTAGAENDLRSGGNFSFRMEARDGSTGFDFSGKYSKVVEYKLIEYTLDDGRKVKIVFDQEGSKTRVTESFEAEGNFSIELQRDGWQAILDNFKMYAEDYGKFEKLHYEIMINARTDKVFRIMLDESSYSEWTSEFSPDSRFKGSWEKGSKIVFLGSDQDGNSGGMVSRIRENVPDRFVSIEHLGIIQNNQEITSGHEVEIWAGALENYTFDQVNGDTLLSVDIDSKKEFKSFFSETWPKALKKLKSICEM